MVEDGVVCYSTPSVRVIKMPLRSRRFTLIELMIVIAIIAIIVAIAIPNLIESRKHANEAAAIKGLRTIVTAQGLFREGDKEGDTLFDYGTLTELNDQNLVDPSLGAGTKQGFTYLTNSGSISVEFIFYAIANPVFLGSTGDRAFATNHMGVIFYTSQAVVPVTTDATIPAGMVPIQ